MHIPDGILPLPVTLGGYAVTATLTWICIRNIKQREDPRQDIPKASLLTAAFFLSSLIHIPVPPASIHLLLNGLLGVLLGPFAFPAILIGLFFQAVMFGHGGLTTLGINAVILGVPALLGYGIFRMGTLQRQLTMRKQTLLGVIAGGTAVAMSILLFSLLVITNLPVHINTAAEKSALLALLISHLPLVVLEGAVTGLLVAFLLRTNPQLLRGL